MAKYPFRRISLYPGYLEKMVSVSVHSISVLETLIRMVIMQEFYQFCYFFMWKTLVKFYLFGPFLGHFGLLLRPKSFLGWAWANNIRPRAKLGRLALGRLWAWANLGPSLYIGPGRFGLGRAWPKPIPNVISYDELLYLMFNKHN